MSAQLHCTKGLDTKMAPAMQDRLFISEESSSDSGRSDCLSNSPSSDVVLHEHLKLLNLQVNDEGNKNVATAPVFTEAVRAHEIHSGRKSSGDAFTQYGLLGGRAEKMSPRLLEKATISPDEDPRIYYNAAAPSSVFICGSQGSGKSHTLSCLLENCLVESAANVLPRPLTGVVFHYDTFISDTGGSPCEAAYLSSNPKINVRVVCAPTNIGQIKRIYGGLPNVKVEELRLRQTDLNTKRMLDLMAVTTTPGAMPLYLHVVVRVLRDLRIAQQQKGTGFDYGAFKRALDAEVMTKDQLSPLQQRLETLESFMVNKETSTYDLFKPKDVKPGKPGKPPKKPMPQQTGTSWAPKAGQLIVVDLSCPCVTPEMACSMFNMCLGLVLEQSSKVGRVIALDEAHKYMTDTGECLALTETLLSTIRLQRHLGARVIISTQEPTISPRLLDLCSVTIVHRFTSPDWLHSLRKHLAGASLVDRASDAAQNGDHAKSVATSAESVDFQLLSKIIALNTGEALLFAPTAVIGVSKADVGFDLVNRMDGVSLNGKSKATPKSSATFTRLGNGVLKVRIRKRVTSDGGKSIMAA
ncbi:hypothetical protein HJFPF1_05512 [Paramyrothecium foliicola]|nr:hypothetical protein HJFPF1_05512 [Paramyrothecium foliicola]